MILRPGKGKINYLIFYLSSTSALRTRLQAVVVDPEVVFVANLMKADAPALVASFQCAFSLLSEDSGQAMEANVRNLKVLACPFIRMEGDKAETTVCLLISTNVFLF